MYRHLLASSLAVGLMGFGGAAKAAYTWALNSSNNAGTETAPTFREATGAGDVVVTGWTEDTIEGSALVGVPLTESGGDIYAGGIRIDQNNDPSEDPPQHALDNDAKDENGNMTKGRESLVFQFTESIALQQIGFEWARECSTAGKTNDTGCLATADVDVWYYAGAGAPTLAGQTYA
jgi:hypothetical protein